MGLASEERSTLTPGSRAQKHLEQTAHELHPKMQRNCSRTAQKRIRHRAVQVLGHEGGVRHVSESVPSKATRQPRHVDIITKPRTR